MNWRDLLTVYRKELKDQLRDRRTLISMIIIPTFMMPLCAVVMGKTAQGVFAAAHREASTVMVLGGEDSPGILAELRQDQALAILPATADWKQRIGDKKIRAAVMIPAGFEAGLKGLGPAQEVMIYDYEGELKSGIGANALDQFFRGVRERAIAARLADRGLPAALAQPFEWKTENAAPLEKVGGNIVGTIVPYVIILLCFTGAMYPAMDLTAGEKERGTMETLLCSPVARIDLVLGKFLMVLTSSLAATALSVCSMGLTLLLAHQTMPEIGDRIPQVAPAGILGVFALVLPAAVLFSAVEFTVALFAKSFKEAQSYVSPLMILVFLPAMVGMLPGIELDWRLSLVPILNVSLACKEMLSGVWHWPYLALIFASTSLYAGAALALAVRMFNREDVLFRS
jgi:sodium transport system permease protein